MTSIVGYALMALAALGFSIAGFLLARAVVPDYGITMGDQMVNNGIWTLASLLAAVGLWLVTAWSWVTIPVVFLTLWGLRWPSVHLIEKWRQ